MQSISIIDEPRISAACSCRMTHRQPIEVKCLLSRDTRTYQLHPFVQHVYPPPIILNGREVGILDLISSVTDQCCFIHKAMRLVSLCMQCKGEYRKTKKTNSLLHTFIVLFFYTSKRFICCSSRSSGSSSCTLTGLLSSSSGAKCIGSSSLTVSIW